MKQAAVEVSRIESEKRKQADQKSVRWQPLLLAAFLLVSLLAVFLRFYALDASSLWSDEGNTWALIQRSFAQIAVDAAADIHPPGYYWLLKVWSLLFGSGAFAMRSLSALCGVLLVIVIYQIGCQLHNVRLAIFAALLAALNPFQIYYSQEARMYMLLALESAGLMWALLAMEAKLETGANAATGRATKWFDLLWPSVLYVICAAAGLWTHYSFPIVLLAAGCYWLLHTALTFRTSHFALRTPKFILFPLLNLLALFIFLPWLPTAFARIFAWPGAGKAVTTLDALTALTQTLLAGPLTLVPDLPTLLLLLVFFLPLIAVWRWRRVAPIWLLLLWWLFPIGLMVGAGLIREAYLKFLLVASPAWSLLTAAAWIGRRDRPMQKGRGALSVVLPLLFLLGIGLVDMRTLQGYYHNPASRDNYQGVTRYIAAMSDPAHDLVLLDAPGQLDVWRYYDPGLPILALPGQRPPDEAQTIQALEAATQDRHQIFALFWATDEADPSQMVERWLDAHAFKGLDQWQGNLRFATYVLPSQLQCQSLTPPLRFGMAIELQQLCQPATPQQVHAGSAAILGLHWQTTQPLATRYKVTLQLLDRRGQLIAQQDSEPGGGSLPTLDWKTLTPIVDNHGLVIPPGVPPGSYRLIVALYDEQSGERLPTSTGDFAELGAVDVTSPAKPIPVEIIPIQHRLNRHFPTGVTLVGYDLYERGYAHDPTRPLQAGATVHLTFYWQAPIPLPSDWQPDQVFTLTLGNQSLQVPLAGGNYPTAAWLAGEFVRGEFEILFDGRQRTPSLTLGQSTVKLSLLP